MFTLRVLLRPYHLLTMASLTLFVLAISWEQGQTRTQSSNSPKAPIKVAFSLRPPVHAAVAQLEWSGYPLGFGGTVSNPCLMRSVITSEA